MRRRRKNDPNSQDKMSWLLTYSDMITLCLVFFVLLYSFSNLDTIKWKSVVLSLQGALGPLDGGKNLIDGPPGNDPPYTEESQNSDDQKNLDSADNYNMDDFLKYQEEIKKLESIQEQLSNYLADNGISNSVSISMEERGLILRFQDSVLFVKGKADLLKGSIDILIEVASVLKDIENPIRIEGHTDDLPISTVQFPSNWELSTTRATNVLRFMIDQDISGERLSAVGYGEFHPISPNDNEENRRKNRRVDIVIIRESLIVNEPK